MKNKIICTLVGVFLLLQTSIGIYAADTDRVVVPDGYINSSSKITVETSSDKDLESIRVKLDHGAYQDITDTKSFSVDKNCTAYVKIRYKSDDGRDEINEITKEITNYDGNPPKVSAYIKGEDLNIQITDEISGAKYLSVDDVRYTDLKAGSIGINLKDLEKDSEFFTIIAEDNAGNRTNTLRVYNPYYVGEDPKSNSDQSVDNPQSASETKPTSATGTITSHTDEEGEDMMGVSYKEWKDGIPSGSNGSKQFFTIKTKSDKTFYIVVDESYNQQTAYLLTEASENDLLNFVNYDGNSIDTGETIIYTIPKSDKKDITKEASDTDEPVKQASEKKKSSIGIILIAAIAGAGVYYFKFKKKKDQDDADEYSEEQEFEDSEDENFTK